MVSNDCFDFDIYIEDIQVFGVNTMSFISLSEVEKIYIS